MSIYVDDLTGCLVAYPWTYDRSCHLMADTEEQLIAFGKMIGCKPEWLQHSRTGVPHFDLNSRMREMAIEYGAKEIKRRKVCELIKRFR